MRPYTIHPRDPSAYQVPASPAPLTRPNRLSAGMSSTYARKKRRARWNPAFAPSPDINLSDDALRLSVRGTLDPLAYTRFDLTKRACPCCGSKEFGKLARVEGGPKRMTRLRSVRLDPNRLP